MAIDKATLAIFPRIWAEWEADGKKRENLPLDREAVATRLRDTVEAQWQLRVDLDAIRAYQKERFSARKDRFLAKVDEYLRRSPVAISPPAKFARLEWEDYTAYAADAFGISGEATEVVEDEHTQNGIACRTELGEKVLAGLDGNALRWDMHYHATKATGEEPTIGHLELAEIVPGTGYHWYKLGTYSISENSFLWMYGVGIAIEVGDARDPLNPTGEYDIWVRARFDGPAFRGREAKTEKDAVSIEWVVAVEKGKI
jgi:hypothetical protein